MARSVRLAHRIDVHAVDLFAGNAEGGAALGEIGRLAFRRAVVLYDEDDRQEPARRHVEAFGDLALVGGAVAHEGDADLFLAAIGVGEGEARPDGDLRADNAMAAIKPASGEHVHGAALAARGRRRGQSSPP